MTASRVVIRRSFGAIAGLQPVEWRPDGLLCSPRAAPELAREALERWPLVGRPVDAAPLFPSPPSAWVAGWYRRSPQHAAAPKGVRELVQIDGEGFGAWGHPTTALCLAALPTLPSRPALDVGCGSGLLSQAWVKLHHRSVLGVDLDARAAAQARRSAALAGCGDSIAVREGAIEALTGEDLDGRIVLANVAPAAHRALITRLGDGVIAGAVLAGFRSGQGGRIVHAYRRLGLRPTGVARSGAWERWTLVRARPAPTTSE